MTELSINDFNRYGEMFVSGVRDSKCPFFKIRYIKLIMDKYRFTIV